MVMFIYGSTIQTLKERLRKHKTSLNCSSRDIIANGDYDIILIENFTCESKLELETRERYFIENNNCINILLPRRSQKEYQQTEQYKIWRKENYKKNMTEEKKEKENERLNKLYHEKGKEYHSLYYKKTNDYRKSWGGDLRSDNCNLLRIDPLLFD
jgi:predicted choloylglycine hydrolase